MAWKAAADERARATMTAFMVVFCLCVLELAGGSCDASSTLCSQVRALGAEWAGGSHDTSSARRDDEFFGFLLASREIWLAVRFMGGECVAAVARNCIARRGRPAA